MDSVSEVERKLLINEAERIKLLKNKRKIEQQSDFNPLSPFLQIKKPKNDLDALQSFRQPKLKLFFKSKASASNISQSLEPVGQQNDIINVNATENSNKGYLYKDNEESKDKEFVILEIAVNKDKATNKSELESVKDSENSLTITEPSKLSSILLINFLRENCCYKMVKEYKD